MELPIAEQYRIQTKQPSNIKINFPDFILQVTIVLFTFFQLNLLDFVSCLYFDNDIQHQLPLLPTPSNIELNLEDFPEHLIKSAQSKKPYLSARATPPLRLESENYEPSLDYTRDCTKPFTPSKLSQSESSAALYTPLFLNQHQHHSSVEHLGKKVIVRDTSLEFNPADQDQLEQGSGNWNNQILDDPNETSNDVSNMNKDPNDIPNLDANYQATRILTPRFPDSTPYPSSPDNLINKTPVLNRRFPKLSVVTGKFWRHFIPYDTFLDEDGDLRRLKSTIVVKRPQRFNQSASVSDLNIQTVVVGDYFSWIQYDQSSKLLYGLPTDDDAGLHQLVLIVKDKFGAVGEEIIEIYVKQHQSTRAHSHLFVLHNVTWDLQAFPSMVDALGEFVKRIATKIYYDQAFDNTVIKYYKVENLETTNQSTTSNLVLNNDQLVKASFTLAWYNSSVPIHPCNTSILEGLLRPLIDDHGSSSTLSMNQFTALQPSRELIKVADPEFKPTQVDLEIGGACEPSSRSIDSTRVSLTNKSPEIRVRNRIGSLNYFLGQPIDYKIPADTFEVDSGALDVKDLHLSMLTIDGRLLEEDLGYNFMEFDKETQTLYGLPYDYPNHSGQKELLLIAIDPQTGKRSKEVFVLNVEPFDLTSINNRAFKISLYLVARTIDFGPREKVLLSYRMMQAIKLGDLGTKSLATIDREEFIVTEVQKFSSNLDTTNIALNSPTKIVKIDDYRRDSEYLDLNDVASRLSAQDSYLYKFSWTNSTIGQRGDCPVEVLQRNILYALEQSMMGLELPDDSAKNDSARFFGRLGHFFEPEVELLHLRFEPTGSCLSEMEFHDIGRSDIADLVDGASNQQSEQSIEPWTHFDGPSTTAKPQLDPNDDEYWSIVVLIILVVALIFVIVMFFMGIHTYKMNQDQRLELQLRLAQARHNSMYLSSVILANQVAEFTPVAANKQAYDNFEGERSSRKPVILDNERALVGPQGKQTAVQLEGYTTHTLPLRPATTFTLDSIAAALPIMSGSVGHSSSIIAHLDDKRAVTLQRRTSSQSQRLNHLQQTSMYNLTHGLIPSVLPGPVQVLPIVSMPVDSVLKRRQNHTYLEQQQRLASNGPIDGYNSTSKPLTCDDVSVDCSSSTAQSIISNPNFVQNGGKVQYGL